MHKQILPMPVFKNKFRIDCNPFKASNKNQFVSIDAEHRIEF